MVARCGRQDEGEELLNKLFLFYFFFEHKKCSRNFVKLWLNPWCHLDYFIKVRTTILSLGTFQMHYSLLRVRELLDFIKNILIYVPKMNKGFAGLERHESN